MSEYLAAVQALEHGVKTHTVLRLPAPVLLSLPHKQCEANAADILQKFFAGICQAIKGILGGTQMSAPRNLFAVLIRLSISRLLPISPMGIFPLPLRFC